MKNTLQVLLFTLMLSFSITACEKEESLPNNGTEQQNGTVSGKVVDAKGTPLAGIKVVLEHTVWAATYVFATTDANGNYKAQLPADPAGSWTAKAQIEKLAFGKEYTFDLAVDNTAPFSRTGATVRNFTWKLSGEKPEGTGYYGGHVDLYQWGTNVPMKAVKLIFTPYDPSSKLIDGSPVQTLERQVEDVAGTFMVRDIPIGHYLVKAVYPGRTLLLENRHKEEQSEVSKPVVFGKHGHLAETEYNVEFWLSE